MKLLTQKPLELVATQYKISEIKEKIRNQNGYKSIHDIFYETWLEMEYKLREIFIK